jgi:hypothetical protein
MGLFLFIAEVQVQQLDAAVCPVCPGLCSWISRTAKGSCPTGLDTHLHYSQCEPVRAQRVLRPEVRRGHVRGYTTAEWTFQTEMELKCWMDVVKGPA